MSALNKALLEIQQMQQALAQQVGQQLPPRAGTLAPPLPPTLPTAPSPTAPSPTAPSANDGTAKTGVPTKNNTMLYAGIGGAVLIIIIVLYLIFK